MPDPTPTSPLAGKVCWHLEGEWAEHVRGCRFDPRAAIGVIID